MFVYCECCALSGRGLRDELITRPEESYRLWCVAVCDLETSRMRMPWPMLGRNATRKKEDRATSGLDLYPLGRCPCTDTVNDCTCWIPKATNTLRMCNTC